MWVRENRLVTQRDSVEVLLVEDDPADALMIQEALAQSAVTVHLHVAVDGEQALRFLRKTHEFAGVPRPSLVMLDLNLPRRGGLEVLAEMKTDSDLLAIPVVILTTSHAESDIQRSYSMHANSYVTKPLDFDSFSAAIAQIASWFLEFIQLPASSLPACAVAAGRGRGPGGPAIDSPQEVPSRRANGPGRPVPLQWARAGLRHGRVFRRDLPQQHLAAAQVRRRVRPRHRPQADRAPVLPATVRALVAVRRRSPLNLPSGPHGYRKRYPAGGQADR